MAKQAVVLIGAKQYHVEENDILEVERLPSSEGKEIKLEKVLLVKDNGKSQIGQPFVLKASVICEALGEFRKPKVISFKIKRRKNSRRKKGHRQTMLRLRVKSIQAE